MLPRSISAWMLFLASFVFIFTNTASAHCDSMEGPVVKASQKALETGNTGLKPVGYKPEKGIEVADIAIETNSIDKLLSGLNKKHHAKIKDYFAGLQSKKNYDVNDVKAGREYVESYVHFIHYVEELYGGKETNEKI